ncbi:hypothetical protein [Caulobacter hibisci]|uniref:Uncharacterized protein n=1 Tax=Caulobacter hibisci TaxID=2035993 RepID=A0ABS0T2Y6_9CAUL|nr:hypothetical protein [Caulobacter hibisci]MBI1686024.1 hypothetical protein [Caulobacter hibisci]
MTRVGRWILAALAIAVLAGVAYIRWSPSVAQDVCLDGGGRWLDGACVDRRPGG